MSEILSPAYKQSSLSILMKSNYRTRLLLEVSQPKAAKKSDWRNPYEEGKNLPRSVEEDIGVYLLDPQYSPKQLRTIRRRERESIRNVIRPNYAKRSRKRESRQSHKAWALRGLEF